MSHIRSPKNIANFKTRNQKNDNRKLKVVFFDFRIRRLVSVAVGAGFWLLVVVRSCAPATPLTRNTNEQQRTRAKDLK